MFIWLYVYCYRSIAREVEQKNKKIDFDSTLKPLTAEDRKRMTDKKKRSNPNPVQEASKRKGKRAVKKEVKKKKMLLNAVTLLYCP